MKLDTKLLSETVSVGMKLYITLGFLSAEATHTSDFIENMDKLFDLLYPSVKSAKQFNCRFVGWASQLLFLEERFQYFNNVRILN